MILLISVLCLFFILLVITFFDEVRTQERIALLERELKEKNDFILELTQDFGGIKKQIDKL